MKLRQTLRLFLVTIITQLMSTLEVHPLCHLPGARHAMFTPKCRVEY